MTRCTILVALLAACNARTSNGGGDNPAAKSTATEDGATVAEAADKDTYPLLDSVRKAVPDASSIEDAKLGTTGLKGYWVDLSGEPHGRGIGVVSADDKTFLKREDGMRRVLATGTKDALVLARASMLLLEHGGSPLGSKADLPAKITSPYRDAIAPPALSGNTLTYWSYYSKTRRPELIRSEVDLAAFKVVQHRPGEDVDPVDKALGEIDSPNEGTRRGAIEAIAKACSDPRAPAALARILRTHARADVRALAAENLATCHDKAAVPALIGALAGDANAEVRQWAAGTLGDLGDASARAALEKAAQSDKDDGVRRLAEKALKKLP